MALRILVVDDDATCRSVLTALLARRGTVDGAASGAEALRLFAKAGDEGRPYELVCLDIELPDLGGLEVLKALRAFEEARSRAGACKVVMVTAHGDPRNVMSAFRHQCEGFITKPVTAGSVAAHLAEIGL